MDLCKTDPRADFVGFMREELMMLGMSQAILDEWLARHPALRDASAQLDAYLAEFPNHRDIFHPYLANTKSEPPIGAPPKCRTSKATTARECRSDARGFRL
jgi:hypothetical protein